MMGENYGSFYFLGGFWGVRIQKRDVGGQFLSELINICLNQTILK